MKMTRHCTGGTYALTTSATTTPEILIEGAASGEVFVPTGSPITTLTFHAAMNTGGTYTPMYDASGVAVTQTVAAARAYPLPAIAFGAATIRIVVNAAGSVGICLKS